MICKLNLFVCKNIIYVMDHMHIMFLISMHGFCLALVLIFHLPAFAIHTCHQVHTSNLAVMLSGHAILSHFSIFILF